MEEQNLNNEEIIGQLEEPPSNPIEEIQSEDSSNPIEGNDGDNQLYGTAGDDTINGYGGNDGIAGGQGDDTLNGGPGDDYIAGEEGDDLIDGGEGFKDRMFGGEGNDIIIDPDGVIGAHGGPGNDTIEVEFAPDWDNNTNPNDAPRSDGKITGGFEDDTITVTMNHDRFLINLKGDEPVSPISDQPEDGNDVIQLLGQYAISWVDMGGGNDTFYGGIGSDRVSGSSGDDILYGGDGADWLDGNSGNDWLYGGAGNDNLNGGEGRDRLFGGIGNDNLNGGEGRDRLVGGAGDDNLTGGEGRDRFVLTEGEGTDTITDFEDGQDFIVLDKTLTFGQLTFTQSGSDALIRIGNEGELLASLKGVDVNLITEDDFIMLRQTNV